MMDPMNPEDREKAAEQWLAEALERYRVPPHRSGLESRILQGLQLRARQRQRRWTFAFAAAAVALALVALAPNLLRFRRETANVARWTPEDGGVKTAAGGPAPPKASVEPVRDHHGAERSKRTGRQRPPALAANARRERFPMAQPLSEQQRRLSAYLSATPRQELLLVAARQRAETIPALHIAPIEIKDLTPKETRN